MLQYLSVEWKVNFQSNDPGTSRKPHRQTACLYEQTSQNTPKHSTTTACKRIAVERKNLKGTSQRNAKHGQLSGDSWLICETNMSLRPSAFSVLRQKRPFGIANQFRVIQTCIEASTDWFFVFFALINLVFVYIFLYLYIIYIFISLFFHFIFFSKHVLIIFMYFFYHFFYTLNYIHSFITIFKYLSI